MTLTFCLFSKLSLSLSFSPTLIVYEWVSHPHSTSLAPVFGLSCLSVLLRLLSSSGVYVVFSCNKLSQTISFVHSFFFLPSWLFVLSFVMASRHFLLLFLALKYRSPLSLIFTLLLSSCYHHNNNNN